MKEFISWSGTLGQSRAEVLRQWLPAVIQAVKPYYTPDDITKGTRWTTEISKELEESQVGIICVTRDSYDAPWIMFEAGALSKNIDKARVCPILFDLRPADVQGPLVQFQLAQFEQKEMKRVIRTINDVLAHTNHEGALTPSVLDSVFEVWWPQLNQSVSDTLQRAPKKGKLSLRSERDLLEEILKLSRTAADHIPPTTSNYGLAELSALISNLRLVVDECQEIGLNDRLRTSLRAVWRSVNDLLSGHDAKDKSMYIALQSLFQSIEGTPKRRRGAREDHKEVYLGPPPDPADLD